MYNLNLNKLLIVIPNFQENTYFDKQAMFLPKDKINK